MNEWQGVRKRVIGGPSNLLGGKGYGGSTLCGRRGGQARPHMPAGSMPSHTMHEMDLNNRRPTLHHAGPPIFSLRERITRTLYII